MPRDCRPDWSIGTDRARNCPAAGCTPSPAARPAGFPEGSSDRAPGRRYRRTGPRRYRSTQSAAARVSRCLPVRAGASGRDATRTRARPSSVVGRSQLRIDLRERGVAAGAGPDARDRRTGRGAVPERDIRDRRGRIANRQDVQGQLIRGAPVARGHRETGCSDDLPPQSRARQPGRPTDAPCGRVRRARQELKPYTRVEGQAAGCQMLVSKDRQRREMSSVIAAPGVQRPQTRRHSVDELADAIDGRWRDRS